MQFAQICNLLNVNKVFNIGIIMAFCYLFLIHRCTKMMQWKCVSMHVYECPLLYTISPELLLSVDYVLIIQ